MCLELLEVAPESPSRLHNGKTTASVFAEWLRSSGLESTRGFVHMLSSKNATQSKSMDKLVALMFAEGEASAPWRWFIRSSEQRTKETKLDAKTISTFRQKLLWRMVSTQANRSVEEGIVVFMQAFRKAEVEGIESAYIVLRAAGAHLVNHINSGPLRRAPAVSVIPPIVPTLARQLEPGSRIHAVAPPPDTTKCKSRTQIPCGLSGCHCTC
jgi:hypothetical protein